MSTIKQLILILIPVILLSACNIVSDVSPVSSWDYSDLRALDPLDGPSPTHELIAAYYRSNGTDFQFRLDFLDLNLMADSDIFLVLDTKPGGTARLPLKVNPDLEWDTLVWLPANDVPRAYHTGSGNCSDQTWQLSNIVIPRETRDPWNDFVVISLDRSALSIADGGMPVEPVFKFKVFLTGSNQIIGNGPSVICLPYDPYPNDTSKLFLPVDDDIGPIRSDHTLDQHASLLISFWDTFPAYTPAQALRRWDGAHTGPFGGRHGLRLLLLSARKARVPIVLLDLLTPASLSALDYVGGMPLIQRMASDGLLVLPQVIPGSPDLPPLPLTNPGSIPTVLDDSTHWRSQGYSSAAASMPTVIDEWKELQLDWNVEHAISDSRQAASDFGLTYRLMLYSPQVSSQVPDRYPVIFTQLDETTPVRWQDRIVIPIPDSRPGTEPVDAQVTIDGLALPIRRTLLANALDPQNQTLPILELGGDLPNSPWGDPTIGQAAFEYIAAHPWINTLDADDLAGFPSHLDDFPSPGSPIPFGNMPYAHQYQSDSGNSIATAAWQAYVQTFAPLPPDPPDLPALRSQYADQANGLLAAAHWAAHPYRLQDCTSDPDRDGQPECLMATQTDFALFENQGGRLVFWITRGSQGIHQVIAPGTQFITGLADPSIWDLNAGAGADPASLPGAFLDSSPPWQNYQASFSPDGLTFTTADGSIRKTFGWSEDGLHVIYQTTAPIKVQITLGIDPWIRFTSGWGNRYQGNWSSEGWSWGLVNGPQVQVTTSGNLTRDTFNDTHTWMSIPEDPNFSYPRGHYLPFPLALVEIQGDGLFEISIHLEDP